MTVAADTEAPLTAYAYSYPHKSSYDPLVPSVALCDVWRDEDCSHLFLYVHVPFCEMRCGFCNLFTASQPQAEIVNRYLDTLERQMAVVHAAIPDAHFEQMAIGGGTPTYLTASQLERLFHGLTAALGADPRRASASVEISPATADSDRLQALAAAGVQRISIGVQSFDEQEAGRMGRPQRSRDVHAALGRIRRLPFAVVNIDLIYGGPEQSAALWIESIRQALEYAPEELYLYPLYLRAETGLAGRSRGPANHRIDLYRCGRELLLAAGYRQLSLRCFSRSTMPDPSAGVYSCQRDGMIGLGCGARSYTRALHYGTRFAVRQAGIRAILDRWIAQTDDELALATHGIWLNADEARRRFVILSLLQAEGLSRTEFEQRFGADPLADRPELNELLACGWLSLRDDKVVLTEAGMENSDRLGPLLYSPDVRRRLLEFIVR